MKEVTVVFPSGTKKTVPYGTRTADLIEGSELASLSDSLIATMVNNEPTSLSYKIEYNATLEPITLDTSDGSRIYRRSLCFLLAMAAKEVLPDYRLIIGHSLGDGYYHYFEDKNEVSREECLSLEKKMKELVEKDLPIQRKVVSYTDGLKYFEEINQTDTLLLMKYRNDNKIPVYVCGNFMDISYRPLAPSTGMLKYFEIKSYQEGFLLRYPSSRKPRELQPFTDNPVLFSVYKE